MATITIHPFDLTGRLATNKHSGEEHTLFRVAGKANRMATPKYGAYYKESLEVRTSTGQPLVYNKDYFCTYYYDEIWDLNAKEVCALIVITNPEIEDNIRITYQAVGGPYSLSVDELREILDEVENSPDKIKWTDIRNKPIQFAPSLHEHEYWQLYGLETTVVNLDMLGEAWTVGRKGVLDDNRYYYKNYVDLAQQALNEYEVKVFAHISDRGNPHLTDKFKIGLGNINNWGMANPVESSDISINNKYQPIGGIYDQLEKLVLPIFDEHIRNMDNPHRVSLNDPLLDLYSVQEIQDLIDTKLKRTEIAYDSIALGGTSASQLYTNIRTGLSVTNIATDELFTQNQLAPSDSGWNPADYALTGNNVFTRYSQLMQSYNDTQGSVYFIGAAQPSSYNHLSPGTFVIRGVYQSVGHAATIMMNLYVYERTSTGWITRI